MRFRIKQAAVGMIEFWGRFSSRERLFLALGGAVAAILIGYQFVLGPFWDRFKMLDRLIAQKEGELVELNRLRGEYLAAKGKISGVEGRLVRSKEGFSLFSHVEGIAVRNQIKDRIVFIRPQPSQVLGEYREMAVELRVENLTLGQVVSLMEGLQNSPQYLRVKRVQIKKRFNNPKLLDGTFVVAGYEKVS